LKSYGERISVAVMPFQNMTNDTTWNVWQNGIQDILITSLSNSEELTIRQTESINSLIQSKGPVNYASMTPSIASKISQKLDANVFIYGNIKQAGSSLRVYAQLIDSKTNQVFKSFQIEGSSQEEKIFQIIDSLSAEVKNFIIISELKKKEESYEGRGIALSSSPEACHYFIYGKNAYYKGDFSTAAKLFSQAIAIDSNFYAATIYLSCSYGNQGLYEKAKKWCLIAYAKKDLMPMRPKHFTDWVHAAYFETPHEEIKYMRRLLEIDDQLPIAYYILGSSYNQLHQYDKAIPEYEKALDIYNKWDLRPVWIYNYTELGDAYHKTGQYKKEKKLYKKAEEDFPNDSDLIYMQAILAFTYNDTVTANKYVDKYISVRRDNTDPEASIMTGLADLYSDAGVLDKSEESYRKALFLEPDNSDRLNNLAWFLIDKDRNINEGLKLNDKALILSPDNYYMLDTKGWGLYKQGKYKEALEFIEKSWDLRPIYDHDLYLHLETVKKAVAGQKNN
jgi:tetratricopeptide (TPR) repeat protein